MRARRTDFMPRMDPEVRAIVLHAGRGKVNPVGFKDLPMPTAMHNPYSWFLLTAVLIGIGVFVDWQMRATPVIASVLMVAFVLPSIILVVWTARRTPAWHRARREVKVWLQTHPGALPPSLRWFG